MSTNLSNLPMFTALASAVKAKVPTLVWGPPGVAKTARIRAMGESWGYHVEVITGSLRDKSDFMGFGLIRGADTDEPETVYSPPQWLRALNRAEKGLLVLDELTTSGEVYKVMLSILAERVVGEHKLGDHVAIVALANPVDEAVEGEELPAAINSRLCHLAWDTDFDAWANGVVTNFAEEEEDLSSIITYSDDEYISNRVRVASMVANFLRSNRQYANETPATGASHEDAWACHRSWTLAIDAMSWLDTSDPVQESALRLILSGCVGVSAGSAYVTHLLHNDIPTAQELLADPASFDPSQYSIDRMYAISMMLRGYLTLDPHAQKNKKVWGAAMELALMTARETGKTDVMLPLVEHLIRHRMSGVEIPADVIEHYEDIVLALDRHAM